MSADKEIFLSYGREAEVVQFVKKLKVDLAADGFSVWLDSDDIPAGCDWHAAIGSGLDQCRALLAVVTPKYVTSRYCTSELYTADGDQKAIFPIFYADTDLSSSERARGVKYVISGINWTMFRPNVDSYEASLERLKDGLRQHGLGGHGLASLATAPAEAPPAASAPGSKLPDEVDGALASAVEDMALSAEPPLTPSQSPLGRRRSVAVETSVFQSLTNMASAPPAPESAGASGVVDDSAPPSYESSLRMAPSQQPSTYPSPGHSPWYPPAGPGMYGPRAPSPYPYPLSPGQSYPDGGPRPPTFSPGQEPPYPGQGMPSPYMGGPHTPGSVQTTPPHPSLYFTGGLMQSPYRSPAPSQLTAFAVGQRLEALDRATNKFCVATVQDVNERGQLNIHFDGYSNASDYWCEPTSTELHPVGWTASCRVYLQPPRGVPDTEFNWFQYLSVMHAQAAPHYLFSEAQRNITPTQPATPTQPSTPHSSQAVHSPPTASSSAKTFTVNMAMEVDDPVNTQSTYICTAIDLNREGNEIKLHYEGWSPSWDFWVSTASTQLHPPGWCSSIGRRLSTPTGQTFIDWPTYAATYGFIPAPDYLFNEQQRQAPTESHRKLPPRPELRNGDVEVCGFRPGMAVEVDDPAARSLTYLCSVVDADAGGKRLKVHYEGWSDSWDFWLGAHSTGMHYMGWCAKNGRALQMPEGVNNWLTYCQKDNLTPATEDLFSSPRRSQPSSALADGSWVRGLALGIDDPDNLSTTYLGSVVEVNAGGFQIKVTYVGWANRWDFWVDTLTSAHIHPIGWCKANHKTLKMPGSAKPDDVEEYLVSVGLTAAPFELFTAEQRSGMSPPNATAERVEGLRVQMRLEAVDRKHPHMTCAAHIKRVNSGDGTIEICFDGWSDHYNYWCSPHHPDIHPIGWCAANGASLHPPKGLPFACWLRYLQQNNYVPMPRTAFSAAQCANMPADGQAVLATPATASATAPPAGTASTSPGATPNPGFLVGMRLEAKDKMNPSLICAASVVRVDDSQGRIEVFFDGWTSTYNYWCSYKETDVHPVGWCAQNNISLQPPHGLEFGSWESYLSRNGYKAVPFTAFTPQQASGMRPVERFTVGMQLEARDRLNPHMVCVATVAQVDDNRLLIHFDGWTSKYDYWCTPDTEDIHPVGWCAQAGYTLQAPKGQSHTSFNWTTYLRSLSAKAAPTSLFWPEGETCIGCFMTGMKLEAVDRKNPKMVAVATIRRLVEGNVTVHFDGWGDQYDYICQRSSPDIHPVGWCARSGRPLQAPRGYGGVFIWLDYLASENARAVPDYLFTEEQRRAEIAAFKPTMRLEAKDRRNPKMIAVATVQDTRNNSKELLIHFDGWTNHYDYWCERETADIHPVGWCALHGVKLHAPKGTPSATFRWPAYLADCGAVATPEHCFSAPSLRGPG